MGKFKSGFAAIIGRPNVGKSTLLNALLGQKVAIISPKPQTTRKKILAVMTDSDSQTVFLDTPGFHKPKNKLGDTMMNAIDSAIGDVDIVLCIVEPKDEVSESEKKLIEKIKSIPSVLVINKSDTVKKEEMLPVIKKYSQIHDFLDYICVSAKNGYNIDVLKDIIKSHLPEGPMYYPEDQITDQQERQIVSEVIREKMLMLLDKEVPHGVAVEILKMKQSEKNGSPFYDISANIYCEKDSHKGIIIGSKGKTLKQIGTSARIECEKMLDAKVYLELWVKVKSDWRNSNSMLKEFGFSEKDN